MWPARAGHLDLLGVNGSYTWFGKLPRTDSAGMPAGYRHVGAATEERSRDGHRNLSSSNEMGRLQDGSQSAFREAWDASRFSSSAPFLCLFSARLGNVWVTVRFFLTDS